MGWDVVPLGLRHRVDTSSIESIAEFLVDRFRANVKCFRVENNDQLKCAECGSFVCEGSEHTIRLEEDKTGYMGARDNWTLYFDWNPLVCGDPDDEVTLYLYADIVDMYSVDGPLRWFDFIKTFVAHEDTVYDDLIRDWLFKFRVCIMECSRLFGCEEVMYVADQGMGAYVEYHAENMTLERLMEYVANREYIAESGFKRRYESLHLDIPDFFINHREPLKEGEDDAYLDVLFDDFRDLKKMAEMDCV